MKQAINNFNHSRYICCQFQINSKKNCQAYVKVHETQRISSPKSGIPIFLALHNLTFFEHFHHSLPFCSFNQQKFIYSLFEVLFAF